MRAAAFGMNVSARSANHFLRAVANGNDILRPFPACNYHRRLVDDDAFFLDIYTRIIRSDIHRNIRRNKLKTRH